MENEKNFISENEELDNNSSASTFFNPEDDYSEILELTAYDENSSNSFNSSNLPSTIVAEYNEIEIGEIDKKHKKTAQSLVSKIANFVKGFKDIELTKEHSLYINEVAKLQMRDLHDLLTMVDMNKQMIENIVRRINSVQADDYALIQSYNSLVNQHIKLLREVQITYKNIPSVIKKMRAEVVTNQEIIGNPSTDNANENNFNNQKDLLKHLRDNYQSNGNQNSGKILQLTSKTA